MIDYDYVECTSSALQGLCLFRHHYPFHRTDEINRAIKKAAKCVGPKADVGAVSFASKS